MAPTVAGTAEKPAGPARYQAPVTLCATAEHLYTEVDVVSILSADSPVREHPAGKVRIPRQGLGSHHRGGQGSHLQAAGSGRNPSPQCCSGPQAPLGARGGCGCIYSYIPRAGPLVNPFNAPLVSTERPRERSSHSSCSTEVGRIRKSL